MSSDSRLSVFVSYGHKDRRWLGRVRTHTGATTMRYLALSTLVDVETCEYPDSRKISIVTGQRGEPGLRKIPHRDHGRLLRPREDLRMPRTAPTPGRMLECKT